LRNKFKFNLLLILLISLGGCSEVSDEAMKAGFKSDTDYYNHLEELRIKRDESFKEKILYAANINAFDTDSSYELAVDKLEKNLRKYRSQDGSNYKLLFASSKILSLNDEFNDYISDKSKNQKEAYDCIKNVGDEPLENEGFSYEYKKAAYDIGIMLCRIAISSNGVSQEFKASHTASRKLANSDSVVTSKEEAEMLFNKFLLKELSENQ
jgi:ribosome-associated translation inhibitor RaiA|tara:strand:- start:163 stop:792 length:630 start_codon:yes stop_codon:yes gene_type:complete